MNAYKSLMKSKQFDSRAANQTMKNQSMVAGNVVIKKEIDNVLGNIQMFRGI